MRLALLVVLLVALALVSCGGDGDGGAAAPTDAANALCGLPACRPDLTIIRIAPCGEEYGPPSCGPRCYRCAAGTDVISGCALRREGADFGECVVFCSECGGQEQ